jgi:predicted amidophosphoribosyltransferase
LDQSEGEIWRRSIIDQLKISVDYFLEGYFPKSIRPFDTVVPVPSSSDSSETIQNKIAIHLREKGLNEARGTVKVNVRGHISTKNIPGLQGRMKSVGARYELGTFNELRSARGLLLIDDVYETGATLRTTVSLLNQVVPEIPKFFLTIAYIS